MQKYNEQQIELFTEFALQQEQARKLFMEKSAAYGFKNIAASGEDGVLVRMSDKFARLQNKEIPGESLDDTLRDLMNYAAILLLLRSGKWPGYTPKAAVENDTSRHLQVLSEGAENIAAPVLVGDVGYDLRAKGDFRVPGSLRGVFYVPTGVRVKAPEGVWTRIVARSSTVKRGLLIPEGVIDNGYTGELQIPCINVTGEDVFIRAGDRLAQLICFPVITPKLAEVEELPATARSEKGFGSTGETVASA